MGEKGGLSFENARESTLIYPWSSAEGKNAVIAFMGEWRRRREEGDRGQWRTGKGPPILAVTKRYDGE